MFQLRQNQKMDVAFHLPVSDTLPRLHLAVQADAPVAVELAVAKAQQLAADVEPAVEVCIEKEEPWQ